MQAGSRIKEKNSVFPLRCATFWLVWRAELVVAFFCAVMFLWHLNVLPLTTPNEGLYAQVAREMSERHDWILPHLNGGFYFEKPPLLYWLMALCLKLPFDPALSARLPSALAGCLTTIVVFVLGQRFYGKSGGTFCALVLSTCLGFVIMAHQVMFDALMTALMTLALACWWIASENIADNQSSTRNAPARSGATRKAQLWMDVTYIALALCVLTKGFIGFLLPLLIVLGYGFVTRDWSRLRPLRSCFGIALFLIIAVPWHVLASLRQADFAWFYFINEHVLRFLGRRHPADFPKGPPYTAPISVIALALPWSFLLPLALRQSWTQIKIKDNETRSQQIFLCCWILVPLVFFTLSKTRSAYYLLPCVPPLALLIGNLWNLAIERNSENKTRENAKLHRFFLCTFAAIFVVSIIVWIISGVRIARFDGKNMEQYGRFVLAFSGILPLVTGSGLALFFLMQHRSLRLVLNTLTAATLIGWSTVLAVWPFYQVADTENQLAAAIVHAHPPDHALIAVYGRLEEHSAFLFYLPQRLRPIHIVEGQFGGDLEFGSRFPESRPLFLFRAQFSQMAAREIAAHRPVYLLAAKKERAIPPFLHLIARQEDTNLWGTQ